MSEKKEGEVRKVDDVGVGATGADRRKCGGGGKYTLEISKIKIANRVRKRWGSTFTFYFTAAGYECAKASEQLSPICPLFSSIILAKVGR